MSPREHQPFQEWDYGRCPCGKLVPKAVEQVQTPGLCEARAAPFARQGAEGPRDREYLSHVLCIVSNDGMAPSG